ncbi:MAG: putative Ig domain-containing protein, partial [Parvibaculales bacterium]
QSVNEGEKLDLLLADDLFIDPEDDNLTLSAVMADGSALPDFIYFDAGQGQFTFEPATNDAQKYDIRVYASDGQLNTFAEFSLTVEDV